MDPFGRIKRSMTSDLHEGATDGALKKSRPDWSNPDHCDETASARALLSHVQGGYDWSPTDPSNAQYTRGVVKGA